MNNTMYERSNGAQTLRERKSRRRQVDWSCLGLFGMFMDLIERRLSQKQKPSLRIMFIKFQSNHGLGRSFRNRGFESVKLPSVELEFVHPTPEIIPFALHKRLVPEIWAAVKPHSKNNTVKLRAQCKPGTK